MTEETSIGGERGEFPPTLWTTVLKAKDATSPERRQALERLIQVYWKPVYLFIRRRGNDVESSKDLPRSFFAAFLEKDFLKRVSPEKGWGLREKRFLPEGASGAGRKRITDPWRSRLECSIINTGSRGGFVLTLSVALLLALGASAQADKLPPPTAAEQAEAEKLIKDVFKDEYAKRAPADRLLLARKMLQQGQETKDDPKSRFVLLREARELAMQAGDLPVAMSAVDELAKTFKVDEPGMRSAILTAAAKNAKSPEDFRGIVSILLKQIDAMLQNDDYEAADKLAATTLTHAKRSQDLPLVNRATAKIKEVAEAKARFDKLKKANETLAASPDDPAANLQIGKFQCFNKGNWAAGLPMLSKSSDAALKALADKELGNPPQPSDQMAVGDGWWDLAEKEAPPVKEILRDHAASWYTKAMAKLAGLSRTKVEKRLSEHGVQKLAKGTWVDVTDPKLFNQKGNAGDPIELTVQKGFYLSARLNPFPKGDFDGVTLRIRLDPTTEAMGWMVYEPKTLAAFVDCRRGIFVNARDTGSSWNHEFSTPWPKKEESVITVLLSEGEYIVYLDGFEKTRVKTLTPRVSFLLLEVRDGSAKFDRIQLRKVE